jgi:hypothetical protein
VNKIKSIYGQEPKREGEYPVSHTVGFDGVTLIEETTDNCGTYGIVWFLVFKGSELACKVNALATAEVHYVTGEGAE